MYILFLTLVAAIGGLLFGYDTAVINGSNEFLRTHFEIESEGLYGWACSCALVGCILGAAIAGVMGDFWGRRKSLMICAFLFAISAVGSALPQTVTQFVIFRIIGGIGVGAASMLSPMYIAEVAPARLRGRLVSLNQLAIVIGILLAFFVNYFIQSYGNDRLVNGVAWNVALGWRWMFASETIAAVAYIMMLTMVPESPRFLMAQGKDADARGILSRIGAPEEVASQLDEITKALGEEQGTLADLVRPGVKTALLIAVGLAIFQQWTGINAILYYSTAVFQQAGATGNAAFASSVAVGVINVLFTFVGIALVDRVGRKAVLIGGAAAQAIMLTAMAAAFAFEAQGWWVLVATLGYVAAFAASLGPVVWVVISEIFPTKIRGRAMSIATVVLWIACYLLSQTFPVLVEKLGQALTFGIYAAMSVLCAIFVTLMVPETKGLSLEEIEHQFLSK